MADGPGTGEGQHPASENHEERRSTLHEQTQQDAADRAKRRLREIKLRHYPEGRDEEHAAPAARSCQDPNTRTSR